MIAIIDYGAGNMGSVRRSFDAIGAPVEVVRDPGGLSRAKAVVLPGVGAFGSAAGTLESSGLTGACREWLRAGRPFLGICLGLQLLFETSDETPGAAALGLLKGTCRRFRDGKVPHVGWNRVRRLSEDVLFEGIAEDEPFYFVHSYYVCPADSSAVAGVTEYGLPFPSVVRLDGCTAVQFHPEKSGRAGLRLLGNWVSSCSR